MIQRKSVLSYKTIIGLSINFSFTVSPSPLMAFGDPEIPPLEFVFMEVEKRGKKD